MISRSAFNKFTQFDKEFLESKYASYSESDKRGLWWVLLVRDFLFHGMHSDPLYLYTSTNYQKWKSIDPEVDKYIDMILEDIYDYGPWPKEYKLDDVIKEVNKLLGREI